MAQIVWSETALADLDAIADYIAIDKPAAAKELVQRIFAHVDQLQQHPESGSIPLEFNKSRYRQIVEPPCRVFCRYDGCNSLCHAFRAFATQGLAFLARQIKINILTS